MNFLIVSSGLLINEKKKGRSEKSDHYIPHLRLKSLTLCTLRCSFIENGITTSKSCKLFAYPSSLWGKAATFVKGSSWKAISGLPVEWSVKWSKKWGIPRTHDSKVYRPTTSWNGVKLTWSMMKKEFCIWSFGWSRNVNEITDNKDTNRKQLRHVRAVRSPLFS